MKKKKLGLIFVIIGLGLILLSEKFVFSRPFSIDRFLIFLLIDLFIGLNISFDIKKIWSFIYKKRYLIGILLFLIIVIRGYNGSSMSAYRNIIEPKYQSNDYLPIIGDYQTIRSDEYMVDTPEHFSQYIHNSNFDTINNALMAKDTTVYMYPQLATKNISVLSNPRLLGFLILPIDQAFSFYWYLPYFLAFFGLFELFMILTKDKKLLSLVGTIMILFSPPILWWNSTVLLAYGSLAVIFFYYLLKSDDKKKKILFSILIGWMGSCYIMILYPAWQVPYAYLFLALIIYFIIINRKEIKITTFLYLIFSIITMLIILLPAFLNSLNTINSIMNTVYPGARKIQGGYGFQLFFNYFASIFYTISPIDNPCEKSQFISLYPLPIVWGLIECFNDFKNKRNNPLLICLLICSIFLSIWNYISIGILANITLFSYSIPERTGLVVGIVCVMLLIVLLSDYEVNKISKKRCLISFITSLIICAFGLYISRMSYMTIYKIILSFIFFFTLSFLVIINTKRSKNIFYAIILLFSLFYFATTNPINVGTSIMTTKPVAKKVQEIVKQDEDSIWVATNATIQLQSYLLANGARVLNSTNLYPNFDLWEKFDEDRKYDEVYNRYAHILINITEEETSIKLIQNDLISFSVNNNEICKLEVDYLATMEELEQYNLKQIYSYDNIYIYEVNC